MHTNHSLQSMEAPLPPSGQWGGDLQSNGHSVQFYGDENYLLDGLARFIGSSIVAGDAAVAIATQAHRDGLAQRLQARGLDIAWAAAQGRYVALDAAETLAKFMVGGSPDPERFFRVIGGVLVQVTAAARKECPSVAAFGEMVALLWAEGNVDAALRLEQLWNDLARRHSFHLLCAYPMSFFTQESDSEPILKICAEHSHVIPSESYAALLNEEDRRRGIIFLQQKAQALATEILERKKVQQALQRREAELNHFLENAVIGMHWVAADGTILWANKAELDLLGCGPEECIGHSIAEFLVEPPMADDLLRRFSRQEEVSGYARLRRKDGGIRHVRIDSNAFVQDGKFMHTCCFILDVTEKKEAEKASLLLAAIVESSDDGIVSKDLNGVVTSWNAAAERIFGYRAEEMVGRPVILLIPPELQDDERLILAKIGAGERLTHFETVRMTKSGERIDVSLTISPVKDPEGNIVGAAKIVRDITRQKKLLLALHTSERLASAGRLAATVAHEINNPLEAVTNFIYLARKNPDQEKASGYLRRADQELARVSHIVQQTLGFYRDNSQPAEFEVSGLIEDVLAIYEHKFQSRELRIEKRLQPDLAMIASSRELKQVLSNLLSNAADASKEGGRIVIAARACRHFQSGRRGVRITVADNGGGISRDAQSKIFTPFFTSKKEVGTGLGLWVAKDLLAKKGGHIRFRSRDHEKSGTVMTIFLPYETGEPDGLEPGEKRLLPGPGSWGGPSSIIDRIS